MEKLLKKLKTDKYPWFGTNLSPKEVAIVIDVLERQIPKKPKMYVGEHDFERYPLCASCGGELIPRGEKLCPCCGQKIEWEEK
ncbi:MAG: hypothetical protein GX763_02615 [Clostridiaceae bacterium]|nr:hypothetical protein [Clostridiaceae bacterium]